MEHILVITAGPKQWFREYIDPRSWTRRMGEGLIGDYETKMEKLRKVDERIRQWTADFDGWISNVNTSMKSALKSNRFIDLAILLADFNNKLKKISTAGRELKDLEESSFDEFDQGTHGYIDPSLFNDADDALLSQAGIFDDWRRHWVAKKLETKKRIERRIALERVVSLAKIIVNKVNGYLDDMAKYRAFGDLGKYIDTIAKISKEQIIFEKTWKQVYKNYFQEMVEKELAKQEESDRQSKQDQFAIPDEVIHQERTTLPGEPIPEATMPEPEAPRAIADTIPELPDLEAPVLPSPEKNISDVSVPTTSQEPIPAQVVPVETVKQLNPKKKAPPARVIKGPEDLNVAPQPLRQSKKKTPKTPETTPAPSVEEPKPGENKTAFEVESALLKYQHLQFLGNLINHASMQDPSMIATLMLKYAEKIDELDPSASIALTKIATALLS